MEIDSVPQVEMASDNVILTCVVAFRSGHIWDSKAQPLSMEVSRFVKLDFLRRPVSSLNNDLVSPITAGSSDCMPQQHSRNAGEDYALQWDVLGKLQLTVYPRNFEGVHGDS